MKVVPLQLNYKRKKIMSTMELEVQKASLAREILSATDERIINGIWLWLNNYNPEVFLTQTAKSKNRKQREEMNKRYSMDLSNFKFNREDANNYE
jgi:hypothetical protein